MTIDQLSRRWKDESGQSAVLVAMLCGLLIFVIAMSTNIGKLVTEKIAMQNAVDLAVYSGAAVQAGKLNEMRDVNDRIWQVISQTRTVLQTTEAPIIPFNIAPQTGPACVQGAARPNGLSAPLADAYIQSQKLIIDGLGLQLQSINLNANAAAIRAAENTAEANYKGTKNLLKPYINRNLHMVKLEQVRIDLTYRPWCFVVPTAPPIPSVYAQGITTNGWYYKNDRGEVAFVAGIVDAHPNSPFLDTPQAYFAANGCKAPGSTKRNGRCGLSVYAAATPFWGKLGASHGLVNGESNDRDFNNPDFEDNRPYNSMRIDYPSLIRDFKPKDRDYEDYRVRFVGLNDPEAQFVQNAGMVGSSGQIGNNNGTRSFRNKLRH